MAIEAFFKNQKPSGSQPNRRDEGGNPKFRYVPESELHSSNYEIDRSLEELSIRDGVKNARALDPKNKNVSEQKNEVGNKREENHIDDLEQEGNSAYCRLDKLIRDAEKPELSEELLSINDQLQEDELLALEAIYGENVFQLERWKGLRCFQTQIYVEVLDEIDVSVRTKLKTSNRDFKYSFKVKYLPPIILTCLLPKSYPSHQPPYFIISVKWLDTTRISSLCSMLDSIWTEQQGQEVTYKWIEWLHDFTLSHLGFDNEITLIPDGTKHVGDERAVSGLVSLELDIASLRSYNNERHQENFLREMHECCICFSVYGAMEIAQLPCQHFFCLECLQTFAQIHVKEGTISNLKCPDAKCAVMIPPSLLKQLLSDDEYERWESLTLENALASMSDVTFCPRCETPCIEDEERHAQCSECLFSFCTNCREPRHVGTPCKILETNLEILLERQNSPQIDDAQKQRELAKINEILSLQAIRRAYRQCPACKMAIERIEGCNKMECRNCGQRFCYLCKSAIRDKSYDHFGNGGCSLISKEDLKAIEEERREEDRRWGISEHQQSRGHGQVCPECHRFNAKVGDHNYLFCRHCDSHYCYSCKQIVENSAEHYGRKGCKRHSDD